MSDKPVGEKNFTQICYEDVKQQFGWSNFLNKPSDVFFSSWPSSNLLFLLLQFTFTVWSSKNEENSVTMVL